MLGASRTSNAALQESLAGQYDAGNGAGFADAGLGLFQVVGLLGTERTLRSTLADPAIATETKTGIVDQLLDGKVFSWSVNVLKQIVSLRWSSDSDMVDATEEAGTTLILMAAEANGQIDRVEEELFRFGRAIDANADLQLALTDPASTPDIKAGIVRTLLEGKAADETIALVSEVAGSLRGRRIQDAVARLSELAAGRRGRIIAEVRTAIALSDEQQNRLAAALASLHGREVELNINIDASVIGGIEVRVGDEVIDGTAATKLEQARRRLAG